MLEGLTSAGVVTLGGLALAVGLLILSAVLSLRGWRWFGQSLIASLSTGPVLVCTFATAVFGGVPYGWLVVGEFIAPLWGWVATSSYLYGAIAQTYERAGQRAEQGVLAAHPRPAGVDNTGRLPLPRGQRAHTPDDRVYDALLMTRRDFAFGALALAAFIVFAVALVRTDGRFNPIGPMLGPAIVALGSFVILHLRRRVTFAGVFETVDGVRLYQAIDCYRPWLGVCPEPDTAVWRIRRRNVEWLAFDRHDGVMHTLVVAADNWGDVSAIPVCDDRAFDRMLWVGNRVRVK